MSEPTTTRSGKVIFSGVICCALLVSAGLGGIIGASPRMQHISMFDITIIHPTPSSMALYGVLVTAGVLLVLFGGSTVLSRYDTESG